MGLIILVVLTNQVSGAQRRSMVHNVVQRGSDDLWLWPSLPETHQVQEFLTTQSVLLTNEMDFTYGSFPFYGGSIRTYVVCTKKKEKKRENNIYLMFTKSEHHNMFTIISEHIVHS